MSEFSIKIDGKDETKKLQRLLKSLKIVDNIGTKSDTATLCIIDTEVISFPEIGKKIEISLSGYNVGIFVIHRISATSSGLITVTAKAYDYKAGFTDQVKKRVWNTTLKTILGAISPGYGLTSVVLKNIAVNEFQNESDSNFLTRVSKDNNLFFKVDSNHLIIAPEDSSKLPEYKLSKLFSWSYQDSLTKSYTGLRTYFLDKKTGKRVEVIVGDPSNMYEHDLSWHKKEDAKKAGERKLKDIQKPKKILSVSCPFSPVVSSQTVSIQGCRDGVNGKWTVQSAEHLLDNKGTKTTLKLRK